MTKLISYSRVQTFWLVTLRVLIGWHFLYEGVSKLLNPGWSAYPYLLDSQGCLSELFYCIADNPTMLSIANTANIWGLTIVGLALVLGFLSRYASVIAICFLAMFYLSHIPFIGAEYMMPSEGSYLWVDKNIIEIVALLVLIYFPTSHIIGIDRLLQKSSNR